MTLISLIGLVVIGALGKAGKEAGYILTVHQAIAGIYIAFRLQLIANKRSSNVSDTYTNEPFEFTPLNHESSDQNQVEELKGKGYRRVVSDIQVRFEK